jgi:hypothetical protein
MAQDDSVEPLPVAAEGIRRPVDGNLLIEMLAFDPVLILSRGIAGIGTILKVRDHDHPDGERRIGGSGSAGDREAERAERRCARDQSKSRRMRVHVRK